MGRQENRIPDDAPGRSLAEFMRQLRQEAGLTWRQIAETHNCYASHTTLSQNADGRLTGWTPVRHWFGDFFRAVRALDVPMTWTEQEATAHARKLWEVCQERRREQRRAQAISAPPASTPAPPVSAPPNSVVLELGPAPVSPAADLSIVFDLSPTEAEGVATEIQGRAGRVPVLNQRQAASPSADPTPVAPPPLGRRPSPHPQHTTPMRSLPVVPAPRAAQRRRAVPASLFRVTSAPDVVASLNDALAAAGLDVSQVFLREALASESGVRQLLNNRVRAVLTGRYPPTPAIIRRIVAACGGTDQDQMEWGTITTPLLKQQPARGRVHLTRELGAAAAYLAAAER